jgi:homoserine dehydrogenase
VIEYWEVQKFYGLENRMSHYRLVLAGFGNVGKAFAKLLLKKRDELKNRHGIEYSVTGIATHSHGMAVDSEGISLEKALIADDLSLLSSVNVDGDMLKFIQKSKGDVFFENTPVNYKTGEPAVSYIAEALRSGMHAITANKGPVVNAYRRLSSLAQKHNRRFYFESAVMDGAPVFSLFRETLPASNLQSFQGILNSTTNMILKRMENGETLEQAIVYAQRIGIAETDPSGDIDGWDAAVKVAALATVLMNVPIKPSDVERVGIRGITINSIEEARRKGQRWKLLCSADKQGGDFVFRVKPVLLNADSIFYQIDGTTSIIQFETDVLGKLTLIEENPGPETTAYGLLADFINAAVKS